MIQQQRVPRVVNVRKAELKSRGYLDFKDWTDNTNHCYIGRNMNVYVPGTNKSKWCNPFPSKKYSLDECLKKYEEHITSSGLYEQLDELSKYKEIGCWCQDKRDEREVGEYCHGHVLVRMLREKQGRLN